MNFYVIYYCRLLVTFINFFVTKKIIAAPMQLVFTLVFRSENYLSYFGRWNSAVLTMWLAELFLDLPKEEIIN